MLDLDNSQVQWIALKPVYLLNIVQGRIGFSLQLLIVSIVFMDSLGKKIHNNIFY